MVIISSMYSPVHKMSPRKTICKANCRFRSWNNRFHRKQPVLQWVWHNKMAWGKGGDLASLYHNVTRYRKINMEPENTPVEKENPLPNHHFQVQAVNLRGCIFKSRNSFVLDWHVGFSSDILFHPSPVAILLNPRQPQAAKIIHSAGLDSTWFSTPRRRIHKCPKSFCCQDTSREGTGHDAGHGEASPPQKNRYNSDLLTLIKNCPLDICGPSHAAAWD